jgi:hypothetical protein
MYVHLHLYTVSFQENLQVKCSRHIYNNYVATVNVNIIMTVEQDLFWGGGLSLRIWGQLPLDFGICSLLSKILK